MRIVERQPANQHRVHDGEDRRVDADSQGEREHGHEGEPAILHEHARGEPNVLAEGHGVTCVVESSIWALDASPPRMFHPSQYDGPGEICVVCFYERLREWLTKQSRGRPLL